MKENYFVRLLKHIGVTLIIVGVGVAFWKGFDRGDIVMMAEGSVLSVAIGTAFMCVSYAIGTFVARHGMDNPTEEFTEAYYEEIFTAKKKSAKISGIICAVLAVLYALYFAVCVITAPGEIERLMKEEKYEQAFDAVMKSKLSAEKKRQYGEELYPLMVAGFERELPREVVLMIDDLKIVNRGNKLYLDDSVGDMELLYQAGQYLEGVRAQFEKDFIYSAGQVIFIEEVSGFDGVYKNVIAVDIRTKNYHVLDAETKAFYFDKLKNGKVLISSDPFIVYDPITGGIDKTELKDDQWEYIYSTM